MARRIAKSQFKLRALTFFREVEQPGQRNHYYQSGQTGAQAGPVHRESRGLAPGTARDGEEL